MDTEKTVFVDTNDNKIVDAGEVFAQGDVLQIMHIKQFLDLSAE